MEDAYISREGNQNPNLKSGYSEQISPQQLNNFPPPSRKISFGLIFGVLGVVLFLIFIIGIVLFFVFWNFDIEIDSSDLRGGKSVEVKEEQKVIFEINDKEHSVTLDSIKSNSVDVTIKSTPIKATLDMGEEAKFDLNDDNFYDLKLKLIKVDNKKAEILLQKISESICAMQGEEYFFDDSLNPNDCCEGLTDVFIEGFVSINDVCYETGVVTEISGGVCSDCGNGICEDVENVCSCPEDCKGKNLSDFNTPWDFCESEEYNLYCDKDNLEDSELCSLCIVFEILNEFEVIGDFCGVIDSEFSSSNDSDFLDYESLSVCEDCEESDALVCLGDNFLNDCKSSSILVFDEEDDQFSSLLFSISNSPEGICESIITFGNYSGESGELSETDELLDNPPPYSNIICPMKVFQNVTEQNETINYFFQENKGTLGFNILLGSFSFFFADVFSLAFIGEPSICRGSFYDYFVEQMGCFNYLDCVEDYGEEYIGFCNPSSRSCEAIPFVGECRNDDQCLGVCANCSEGADMVCKVSYVQVEGTLVHNSTCVDCQSNIDCKDGFVCDKKINQCILGTRCKQDDECSSDEYCDSFGIREGSCIPKAGIGGECDSFEDSCLGDAFCFRGFCIEEDFFDKFEECIDNACTQTCTNCLSGNYICNYITNEYFSGQVCVECFMDSHCNEGYECKLYECIAN